MMTHKEMLIYLLHRLGIPESKSFHERGCFVINKSEGFHSDGTAYKYNEILINSDGRLRRI